jgi:signal transduction histidine kinase/class 3 adenylate cyclase
MSRVVTASRDGTRIAVWILLALLCGAPARGAPLEVSADTERGYHPVFAYVADQTATATLAQVQALPEEAFATSGARGVALGFTRAAVWLRFDVVNRSASETAWLLRISDPLLDDVRVFRQRGDGEWHESRLGDQAPHAPGAVEALSPVLPVTLPANQPTRFYLRIQSKSSMLVNVIVLTPQQDFRASMMSSLGYGAMFGVVAAMILYNLFLFLSLRDPNYLLYVVSISSTALFLATLSGYAPLWLWPNFRAWSEEIFQHVVAVMLVSGLWFCTRFLEAKSYAPRLHQIIVGLIGLSILTVPLSYVVGFQTSVSLTGAVSAAAGTVGLLTATVCLLRGQRSARYYLPAWTIYCIGTVFTAARQHGLVGNNFFSIHGMELGSVLETVLISFALSDRYHQLKIAKEKAQREVTESLLRMDRLKDEFLANTSHELRTPLQGIIGLAESMLDGAAGRVGATAARNLSMIVSSGHRLANLVSDILDFSKMKNHELALRRKPVDLHAAVDVAMHLGEPLAQAKSLALVNEIDGRVPPVLADEDRLQQILHNLIGNAIKFTDRGRVRVNAIDEGEHIRVQVVDTGPGIAAEDQERIFESFEQVEDSATRMHGGTGLGLAVTRKLVELHGGRVEVASTVGEGSTFSFTLPRAQEAPLLNVASEAAESALPIASYPPAPVLRADDMLAFAEAQDSNGAPPAPTGESRIRILIVDDEPINQQVMLNHLVLENYDVVQAENGVRALELLGRGERFDLILLDVMMPALSGFEVCREIRKSHLPTQLPIVMVTARTQTQDLRFGLQVGANDYISKPVAKEELLARIKTQLNLLRINSAYSLYVPHEFLRYLNRESIVDVELGDNVEMEAAVLISDIRHFTALSESMTPDETFTFINDYFAAVGPSIRRHGGFIDHYVGDSIVGVFPSGAVAALAAARDTMESLAALNVARAQQRQEPIRIGIGLHLGHLRLGIVGEAQRRQGDIFADTVNVTSRIEGMTRIYGCSVIVTEAFLAALPDPDAMLACRRALGKVFVKGRSEAVTLHEAFEFDAPDLVRHKRDTRAAFEQAQQLFQETRYTEAVAVLAPILAAHEGDVAARYLLSRAMSGVLPSPTMRTG